MCLMCLLYRMFTRLFECCVYRWLLGRVIPDVSNASDVSYVLVRISLGAFSRLSLSATLMKYIFG
jgi:hypothetical protein